MPSRMFLGRKSNAKVYYTDNLSVCFSNLLTQTRACLTSVKQPVRLFHISLNPPRRTCLFGMPAVKVCSWQKKARFLAHRHKKHYLCSTKQWDGLPLAQFVREESPGNTGHSAT